MNFNYSDDQRMLSDTLNRFLEDNYPHEHRMQAAESDQGFNTDTWQQLCELGIAGALLPEGAGGYGGTGVDISVVFEALGKALVVEPLMSTAAISANLLHDCGAEQSLLDDVIAGNTMLALACYEQDHRYRVDTPDCTATQQADGWQLNGTKTMVLNGDTADQLIVSASVDGALALFLVPTDTAGVTRVAYPTVDGGRGCDVQLNNAGVGASALLCRDAQALECLELAIARANVAIGAEALGAMETCKNMTVEYLQTRKQFGVPIGKFQTLQHRMVDVMIEIEQARSSLINAATALNDDRLTRERNVSAMKNLIGRAARLVAEESIQMHGGIAMTWEYALSHYAKRLVMIDHWFGDTDYHLQRYIDLGLSPNAHWLPFNSRFSFVE